jgi:hypothetical protein
VFSDTEMEQVFLNQKKFSCTAPICLCFIKARR